MRGDANMKLLGALALAVSAVAACEPAFDGRDAVARTGRTAVSWTLNGAPLTASSCQTERITSMRVNIAVPVQRGAYVELIPYTEFLNVTCGLDLYSIAMIPSGPLHVSVEALHEVDGRTSCVRYFAEASINAGSQFPSQPVKMPLRFVADCP